MYTTRKIHSGLIGTLLLVAALLVLFFYIRPAQNEITELRTAVTGLQEELGTLPTSDGKVVREAVSEVEQRELDLKIPETLEQDMIIRNLNRIADETNVTFNALTFNLKQGADLQVISISAGFQGLSNDIVRFLKMVEENPRKFVVVNTGISQAQSIAGLNLVNLNLTMEAFYRHES